MSAVQPNRAAFNRPTVPLQVQQPDAAPANTHPHSPTNSVVPNLPKRTLCNPQSAQATQPRWRFPGGHPLTIQRATQGVVFRNTDFPDSEDEGSGASDSDGGSEASEEGTLAHTLRDQGFDDLTTDEFRENHVVTTNIFTSSLALARARNRPVSTTIMFTASDKENLVDEIKEKTLNGGYATVYRNTNRNINVSDDEYMFVEYTRTSGGSFERTGYGMAKLRYAVQSARTVGGFMYTVTHLDGLQDIQALNS